ncbi:hypothetical protein [Maribellus sp. YY47]|uniref:hypothetical protein n=1 Tax=Maribellus sp. YY47 TaxID=2929486 RepID=UPI0020007B93|nr:hypothetical protein [Maribellus sp. YY47]MCK3682492.1 hypothetical protein [Maribellus sp. YY47]
MKVKVIITMFLLVFAACSSDEENHILSLGKDQQVRLQEEYASPDQNLKIGVEHVDDSRCPTGVVCVWEGEATVYMYVRLQEVNELVLSTVRQPKDTVQNYEIELIDVSPYPDISREIEQKDYKVTLKVRKLDR